MFTLLICLLGQPDNVHRSVILFGYFTHSTFLCLAFLCTILIQILFFLLVSFMHVFIIFLAEQVVDIVTLICKPSNVDMR